MSENCPFDVTPLAIAKPKRNLIAPVLSYTHQDYESLKARMIELLRQSYDQDFNNFMESDIGVMLLEMWAFIADTLSLKIDQLANELYIDTVTELPNAVRLAQLLGFRPTPPTPARTMFVASLNHILSTDLTIETPIVIKYQGARGEKTMELFPADHNDNPILNQRIVIPAGTLSTTRVVGVEGVTASRTVYGTGEANQVVKFDSIKVMHKSIQVTVDGEDWQEVDYFTDSQPRNEYITANSSSYQAYLLFGNGRVGRVPPAGSRIVATYRVGGGSDGNVMTGAIEQSIAVKTNQRTVTLVVKNYTRGEGGYDGDNIEDIRRKLPLYLKTQNRCVTGADYKALIENFSTAYNGQIGKAAVALRNHGCAGNVIDVYILARGEGRNGLTKPGDNLAVELSKFLGARKMLTDFVCIRHGSIVDVDIHINLLIDSAQKKYMGQIHDRVMQRLDAFFGLGNWEFGQTLRETDLVKALADVREVDQFDINFTTVNSLQMGQGSVNVVTSKYNEIIRPDNIEVKFSFKE